MAQQVQINSLKDLDKWLVGKPRDWAQVIAFRVALRAVPVLNRVYGQEIVYEEFRNCLTMSALRACFISEVAVIGPTLEIEQAAVRAAADAIAAYATDAAAYADAAYDADAQWLEGQEDQVTAGVRLMAEPLWHGDATVFLDEWVSLQMSLLKKGANWKFWIDWYQSKLDGKPHPGLPQNQQRDLYYQIATFPKEYWEDGKGWVERAKSVNQRIADLLAKVKPGKGYDFFLSYSIKDESLARLITDIIEQEGYSVFVQFKDMPVGSNFVIEMQEGLEAASRFICLYSQAYKDSSACQAEWSTAFNRDRDGKKRNIISFFNRKYCAYSFG